MMIRQKMRQVKSIKKSGILLVLLITLSFPACKNFSDTNLCYSEDGNGAGLFTPIPDLSCNSITNQSTLSIPTGGTFDLDLLVNEIVAGFGLTPGYQVAVAYNGQVVRTASGGFARTMEECWPLTMDVCNKNNIASVTKTLTASLTLMLLEENNVDETEMIKNWLPPSWTVNSETDSLSFRDLLSHRSGLLSTNNNFSQTLSYEGIKSCLELGVQDSLRGLQRYRNVNYALMRVIIPRLWQIRNDCPNEIKNTTEITQVLANTYYERAIQQLILQPAGISDGSLQNHEEDDKRTLTYNASNTGTGRNTGDWRAMAGGGGWYLSAVDLVLVMQRLFNGDYVSFSMLNKMDTMVMGFWNQPNAEDGQALGHGGSVSAGTGQGYRSMLLHFKSGVSIAYNLNSNNSNSSSNIIVQAYDNARN